ncbi:MAG: DUF971 domain-containing protein [Methylotetracoccus sp.]|jgi:DUF971 family protein|nr:DUF971 domain-containing protein [Methylotetracoccus sp.]
MSEHLPADIKVHRRSRLLALTYPDGQCFELPCEYLRVYSPSAEVRGHGPGEEVLQVGKENVNIDAIEPMGHYGIKLRFSDGHDTGIYTWELLHDLGSRHDALWKRYLERLAAAGYTRHD